LSAASTISPEKMSDSSLNLMPEPVN